MAYHARKNIVTDGLVFHVDAANKVSSDVTDTNNMVNPTEIGAYSSGTIFSNDEFVLDGISDRIDFTYVSDLDLSVFTINVWCKLDSIASGNHHIVSRRPTTSTSDNTVHFAINWNNTANFLNMTSSNGVAFKESRWSSTNLQLETWYNFTMTYDGTDLHNYVNSEIKTTLTESFTPNTVNNPPLVISGDDAFSGREFNGEISNVSIYNRALTLEEVSQNYEALKHRFE